MLQKRLFEAFNCLEKDYWNFTDIFHPLLLHISAVPWCLGINRLDLAAEIPYYVLHRNVNCCQPKFNFHSSTTLFRSSSILPAPHHSTLNCSAYIFLGQGIALHLSVFPVSMKSAISTGNRDL